MSCRRFEMCDQSLWTFRFRTNFIRSWKLNPVLFHLSLDEVDQLSCDTGLSQFPGPLPGFANSYSGDVLVLHKPQNRSIQTPAARRGSRAVHLLCQKKYFDNERFSRFKSSISCPLFRLAAKKLKSIRSAWWSAGKWQLGCWGHC